MLGSIRFKSIDVGKLFQLTPWNWRGKILISNSQWEHSHRTYRAQVSLALQPGREQSCRGLSVLLQGWWHPIHASERPGGRLRYWPGGAEIPGQGHEEDESLALGEATPLLTSFVSGQGPFRSSVASPNPTAFSAPCACRDPRKENNPISTRCFLGKPIHYLIQPSTLNATVMHNSLEDYTFESITVWDQN